MDQREHLDKAVARQAEIYRAMTPAQRLQQALRLNDLMRALMDAALRQEHPDWSEDQRRRTIARRVLNARTG
jgi:hypothetical protein